MKKPKKKSKPLVGLGISYINLHCRLYVCLKERDTVVVSLFFPSAKGFWRNSSGDMSGCECEPKATKWRSAVCPWEAKLLRRLDEERSSVEVSCQEGWLAEKEDVSEDLAGKKR